MNKNKTAARRTARPRPRPSQAERREAMRTRILEATLHCLAQYGYAGTGVAQVVKRARVSRGAWAHHFPSMNALILEAARHLMARVYERVGTVLRGLEGDEDLHGIVHGIWREFFASEVNEIYLELLIASRRDPKLAEMLRGLSTELTTRLAAATVQGFEARPDADINLAELMRLNRWLLRGLALDAPMLPAAGVEQALEAWRLLLGTQLRARKGKRAA